ncbi:uncharacterized protein LOC131068686 [Cryptomeria japonica]|uniref:uncharacterized protein LOC131068686 n=1 Tax=Cryptomeria japonica TaxID=3369 RepID=UPI0027DA4D81|nr:uncharacterized protein LOC131068686 [Cryptomeria japonica]
METKKKQKKGYESSESFWPHFKRRIKKHDGKSKAYADYAVEISGKPKALVRILSVSERGDVVPLTIVSPIEAEVVSVKSQESRNKEEPVTAPSRRSWVRVVVRAFRFSTSRNGKVRQVPSNETSLNVPPRIRTTRKAQRNISMDLTAEPVGQQISEVVQNNPVEQISQNNPIEQISQNNPAEQHVPEATRRNPEADRKKKGGANPHSKLKAHASAPCSPMKSHKLTASIASTSYTHLPPAHISTINIHNSTTTSKSSSKTVMDSEVLRTVEEEGYDVAIGFSPLIIVMLCLVFSDKCVAVLCTCIWWYVVAVLRNMSRFKEEASSSKRSRQIAKSFSHNNIDLQSSEYRKRVIMEGLLQRNNNMKR